MRTIIVSNRLPVSVRSEHGELQLVPSAGGLATALQGPHDLTDGLWIGWPGDLSGATTTATDADAVIANIEKQLEAKRYAPVLLSQAEIAHYYDGFSNGVLWPLLHYLIDKVRLDAERDWQVYKAVNRRFAERVAASYRKGDVIWVHDYQLALVPGMLREMLPAEARIGFFLHVPFPAAELFAILPWRAEILRGLLGADLIGFHTADYVRDFCESVVRVLKHDEKDNHTFTIENDGGDSRRTVRVAAFPIGIDVARYDAASHSDDVARELARILEGARGKKIVLGVDRLDYTKGLPRRLLAFERFLERAPAALRGKVMLIQLAVPTREKVDAYGDLRRTVNELVGRINSHHGSPTASPIQLLYRSIPMRELVGLYRAADVMLVTPLRDGMNLVAKEYVASRVDDCGVLVLSEFAGAAAELVDGEALHVNPYDIDAVSSAIRRGLQMPLDEQRMRMRALRATVHKGDVHSWVRNFLNDVRNSRECGGGGGCEREQRQHDPLPSSLYKRKGEAAVVEL